MDNPLSARKKQAAIAAYWKEQGASTLLANALALDDIADVHQLAAKEEADLRCIPRVGRKSIVAAQEILSFHGLRLTDNRIKTRQIKHAADLLRQNGWTVTPPAEVVP